MTRQGTHEGTPSLDEVEQDFTVPDDADLHPVAHPSDDDVEEEES